VVEFQRNTSDVSDGPLVLFVEDDVVLRDYLATLARRAGFQALASGSVDEALAVVAQRRPDCIVSDIKMPGDSGLALPARLMEHGHRIPIVMLTGEVHADQLEELQRLGIDCLIKPVGAPRLTEALNRLLASDLPAGDVLEDASQADILSGATASMIVGNSPVMQRLREQVDRAGRTRSPVLLQGPHGVGKSLVARAVHLRHQRSAPFVTLDVAAVPKGMIETALFGHARVAHTGKVRSASGAFERAHGGTLLLEQVSELPLDLQAMLLRVLQARTIQHVGGDTAIPVDVRVIATTDHDLVAAVERDEFREDLYYRLNVMEIRVPRLDERREDIPLLASHLLEQIAATHDIVPPHFTHSAFAALCDLDWPGNVRQLADCLERAVLLNGTGVITADTILACAETAPRREARRVAPASRPRVVGADDHWVRQLQDLNLDALNYQIMLEALRRTGGNRRRAAALLGVHVRTVRRHLAEPDRPPVAGPDA